MRCSRATGDLPQALRPPADALPGATPGQAWRSADFWLIVGNLILGVFAVTGVMVHGVPLLQERGLSREVATDVLAALWVGMIVSQPALGYLLDRYDTPRIALPFACWRRSGCCSCSLADRRRCSGARCS
ncbi:hypothetical protein [Pseudomonas aeruginosa]|uniref:hypothetical protein n=1 Tax=Pseudomonas aeruginosa TaxID=287 RepID=UPI000A8DD304